MMPRPVHDDPTAGAMPRGGGLGSEAEHLLDPVVESRFGSPEV